MNKKELVELLKSKAENAEINTRNQGITKSRQEYHRGREQAYKEILRLIELLSEN